MGVTDRGLRAWKRRPPSLRQRRDLILLAHIREQHRLCLGSYGRPRMTEELKALGLQVGQRRVGRLMRQNNITVVRTRKFKRTTDSHHTFNPARNGQAISLMFGPEKDGSILLLSLTCIPVA